MAKYIPQEKKELVKKADEANNVPAEQTSLRARAQQYLAALLHKLTTQNKENAEELAEVGEHISTSAEAIQNVKDFGDFLAKLGHSVAGLERIFGFIPIARLVLGAIVSGIDVAQTIYEKKVATWSGAAKIALAAAFVGALAVGVAIPAIGGIMLAVAVGVQMLKEYRELFDTIQEFKDVGAKLKRAKRDLKDVIEARDKQRKFLAAKAKEYAETLETDATKRRQLKDDILAIGKEIDTKNKKIGTLEHTIPHLQAERRTVLSNLVTGSISTTLSFVGLVGVVMAVMPFPPVQLIGVGLLIASSALAMGVKLANFVYKKVGAKPPAKAESHVHESSVDMDKGLQADHTHDHQEEVALAIKKAEQAEAKRQVAIAKTKRDASPQPSLAANIYQDHVHGIQLER